MSSIRATREPCDFCGSFDKINLARNGKVVGQQNLPNYSYPSRLLRMTDVENEDEVERSLD